MTEPLTGAELDAWGFAASGVIAEWQPYGTVPPMAEVIARLIAEVRRLRAQVQGHAERIAAQSEILSRRAEGPTWHARPPVPGLYAEHLPTGRYAAVTVADPNNPGWHKCRLFGPIPPDPG